MQKISVVVPCFNGEKYIAETIDSILAQSYPIHELIVVNDGSTDSTAALLASYPKIVVLNQSNLGVASALNAGIKRATGDFIAFNDADDIWVEHKLEWQMAALEKHPEQEVNFGWVQNFISPELSETERAAIFCPPAPLKGILKCCMVLRKTVFEKYGLFDEQYRTGDFVEWFSRAQDQGITFGFIDKVAVRRRLHTTNLSSSPNLGSDFAAILKRRLEAKRKGL
jgi:glycosyltransferase involved in cell wall biosynthesis